MVDYKLPTMAEMLLLAGAILVVAGLALAGLVWLVTEVL